MVSFLRRQAINLYQLVNRRRILPRMAELDRLQWLNHKELLALQQQRLYHLLDYACTYVPYYRRLFDQIGFRPADILEDPASFQKIPFLTKPIIRESFDDLVTTEERRRRSMSQSSTAGSTGQPLVFMQDTDFRDNLMAAVHHHLSWTGWEFGQPHAYIFGASFEAHYARNLHAQLMNWALNRFVVNAYVFSLENMRAFAVRAMRHRPRVIFGYASSLYQFAQFVRDNPAYDLRFVEAIMPTSEVLYPAQRKLMEEVFECQVFNRYATRELGPLACECKAHTGLHTSVESTYIEILEDGRPAGPGECGDVVVTNLVNYGMPFIRYQLADRAVWYPEEHCPCGRAHPMLKLEEGRHNDLFKRRDGGTVWGGISNPLWNMEGVRKFQFVQKTYDHVVVKVVKDGPMSQAQRAEVERAVETALGNPVRLDFEFPDDIPVEHSGKHRYQICEIE